jgi:hypothetical protein
MKQQKQKTPVKSARKTAKLDIQQRLIATVKAIALKFGQDEGKLTEKFQKKSKKLAKKISEELKIAKPAATKKPKEIKAPSSAVKPLKVKVVEAPAKKETDSKTAKKPAEKKVVEKKPIEKKVAEKKPQPAKPVTTKSK